MEGGKRRQKLNPHVILHEKSFKSEVVGTRFQAISLYVSRYSFQRHSTVSKLKTMSMIRNNGQPAWLFKAE